MVVTVFALEVTYTEYWRLEFSHFPEVNATYCNISGRSCHQLSALENC